MLSSAFQRLLLQKAALLDPPAATGRRRVLSDSDALRSIFTVCRTGMQWREVASTACYTTVFRRMHSWVAHGVFEAAYVATLQAYRRLCPPTHYCIDSSFVKNAYCRHGTGRNPTDRGRKALKVSVVTDQRGIVHGLGLSPANRPDVTLLGDTLRGMLTTLDRLPLYADRGYDSRRNRGICESYHLRDRIFRRRTRTTRRAAAKRIVVENTFSWIDKYRRLLYAYEQSPCTHRALLLLALGNVLTRRFPPPAALNVSD
jgi:transposase